MSPKNILITGCNRGIGLEFVKQYLTGANPPTHLFATCRNPDKAPELVELSKAHSNLHVLTLDVTNHASFPELVHSISQVVDQEGLNLVLNNAGLLPSEKEGGVTPEKMREAFEVNTIAPLFLSKALLPLVKIAAQKDASAPMGIEKGAIVLMSTAVASISENSGGGNTAYRASKTALNQVMKNLSIELKSDGILVMALHPGWVMTDMGGPNALINTETSVGGMIKTLSALTDKDHASFLRYDGTGIG
ncbi:hypothetical protein TCAL_07908 [Tigriopus californicus]|uniref:C-factor n=2 Tax=Tigriopus californicus TaxID=6832 RepID=A0A553PG94_TIGCA|nr:hypothetical protein TCAL_07908 [Tigriopus californicus]